MSTEIERHRSDTLHHHRNMNKKKTTISELAKDSRDQAKALEESTATIVEKDRLIAQLRQHLYDKVRDDRVETCFIELTSHVRKAESTNNLEATRRERDTLSHKHQELLQDYQRRQSLLKKQEFTMDTQREDIIALRSTSRQRRCAQIL